MLIHEILESQNWKIKLITVSLGTSLVLGGWGMDCVPHLKYHSPDLPVNFVERLSLFLSL